MREIFEGLSHRYSADTRDLETVGEALREFLGADGVLDASRMEDAWFPSLTSDVFISHSHRDEAVALGLAAIMRDYFGLRVFVDSAVWRSSDKLLKMIDDHFCRRPASNLYDYAKRNRSTSHVHMLLGTALLQMIDASECIIFLNTPSSVTSKDAVCGSVVETPSPWIYAEIAMTRLVRRVVPKRLQMRKSIASLPENLDVRYRAHVAHLAELEFEHFVEWIHVCAETPDLNALDGLYSLIPGTL